MIDDRLATALAALPQNAPPCVTATVMAAMLEVTEPEVHALVATGELLPPVLIVGIHVWAIEDLHVWLRRNEPLWDDSDADEPDWFPHCFAIERVESDIDAVASELSSLRDLGSRPATRDELKALTRRYGGRRA